jgi:F0F1-type ATP synthase membrane subunit b/b'
MGDFEIFGIPVSLGTMIYQAFLFTILVFTLKKFFFGKLVRALEKRKHSIDHQLHIAEKNRIDSEKLLLDQQAASAHARQEARELMLQTQQQAASILLAARKDALKIRSEARDELLKLRRSVVQNEKNIC